jgi:hypothetical protein
LEKAWAEINENEKELSQIAMIANTLFEKTDDL